MHTDLKSTFIILGKIQAALQARNSGVFSLQHLRDEFDPVIQMLMELFKGMATHLRKYEKIRLELVAENKVGVDRS